MSKKTAAYLIEYARAQVGAPYWYACFGQKGSAQLLSYKRSVYPKFYTAKDFSTQYGQRVHDCAGLIKGALWSDTPTSAPVYNSKEDYGATGFYNRCTETGAIGSLPEIPGVLLFKGTAKTKTHVGIYAGAGKVIEAKNHANGVIISDLKATAWKFWGKCHLIDYATAPELPPETPANNARVIYQVNTKKSPLRIRNAPSIKAKQIGLMPKGARVEGELASNGWAKVYYNKIVGYASAQYLKVIK